MSKRIPAKLKREVFERAKGCCEYCITQVDYSSDPFSIEHVIPLAKGGLSEYENLAVSCQGCNNFKYDKTESIDPLTRLIVPLYNPRLDNWNDHFMWAEDYLLIGGITPTGRATLQILRLNGVGL